MLVQGLALACESLRLVLTNQILVARGLKLAPIAALRSELAGATNGNSEELWARRQAVHLEREL